MAVAQRSGSLRRAVGNRLRLGRQRSGGRRAGRSYGVAGGDQQRERGLASLGAARPARRCVTQSLRCLRRPPRRRGRPDLVRRRRHAPRRARRPSGRRDRGDRRLPGGLSRRHASSKSPTHRRPSRPWARGPSFGEGSERSTPNPESPDHMPARTNGLRQSVLCATATMETSSRGQATYSPGRRRGLHTQNTRLCRLRPCGPPTQRETRGRGDPAFGGESVLLGLVERLQLVHVQDVLRKRAAAEVELHTLILKRPLCLISAACAAVHRRNPAATGRRACQWRLRSTGSISHSPPDLPGCARAGAHRLTLAPLLVSCEAWS